MSGWLSVSRMWPWSVKVGSTATVPVMVMIWSMSSTLPSVAAVSAIAFGVAESARSLGGGDVHGLGAHASSLNDAAGGQECSVAEGCHGAGAGTSVVQCDGLPSGWWGV
ncbi:hypothetical protein B5808_19240 (plasmid) [Cnuibacter physcomitrellae]|uniref:Uncharacterized protein n=1 Tax=Cnuibacter physcomitrellae TaxID=1619308 RepID=A0A1X9LT87_9MICO|nr:hypothetical protein B5808_19240 [Cnuibacter physcomitrellae]